MLLSYLDHETRKKKGNLRRIEISRKLNLGRKREYEEKGGGSGKRYGWWGLYTRKGNVRGGRASREGRLLTNSSVEGGL